MVLLFKLVLVPCAPVIEDLVSHVNSSMSMVSVFLVPLIFRMQS